MPRKYVHKDSETGSLIFECPHCGQLIVVAENELRCKIFRCGVHVKTGAPINPHLSEPECTSLRETGQAFGCCRPFLYVDNVDKPYVEECGYI